MLRTSSINRAHETMQIIETIELSSEWINERTIAHWVATWQGVKTNYTLQDCVIFNFIQVDDDKS